MTHRASVGSGGGGGAASAQRTFNVSVVGVSGTEREKGAGGVGKSCLCNRFVRPLADEFHTDHSSVLCQSDFSSRVINNDHFLYWGSVTKTEDGVDLLFNVIEQTEFVDDSSFQAFKSRKTEPYLKRCVATKLQSAEKLMYICKNQLGLEHEFEQRPLPEGGKLAVDGFVCCLDVSPVQNRPIEQQLEYVSVLLTNLLKAKKPIVVATTKNDDAIDAFVKDVERMMSKSKDFRQIPLVETSAFDNVNVEAAFLTLAALIDPKCGAAKGRGAKEKGGAPSYAEASRARNEVLEVATEAYQSLIRHHVPDHRAQWKHVLGRVAHDPDYVHYVELFGRDRAKRLFRAHVARMRDEFVGRKRALYLQRLPHALREAFPDLASGAGDLTWDAAQRRIAALDVDDPDLFDAHFVASDPPDLPWDATDHADLSLPAPEVVSRLLQQLDDQRRGSEPNKLDPIFGGSNPVEAGFGTLKLPAEGELTNLLKIARVPLAFLAEEAAAENAWLRHVETLEAEERRRYMMTAFKGLLEASPYVVPGKCLHEVAVFFIGRESYETLSESDRLDVYSHHQRQIIHAAKENFKELLLEKTQDVFSHYDLQTLIQEDLDEIHLALVTEPRYQALSHLAEDRNVLLLRHLGFLQNPFRDTCPSGPGCNEIKLPRFLNSRLHRPQSFCRAAKWGVPSKVDSVVDGGFGFGDDTGSSVPSTQLNLIVLGSDGTADSMIAEVRHLCLDDEFVFRDDDDDDHDLRETLYNLDYRPIAGDVSLPANSFWSEGFLPHGCICVYNSYEGLFYIKESLKYTMMERQKTKDVMTSSTQCNGFLKTTPPIFRRSASLADFQGRQADADAREDRGPPLRGLPVVIVMAKGSELTEDKLEDLRQLGRDLAISLQCPFVDLPELDALDATTTMSTVNGDDQDFQETRAFSDDQIRATLAQLIHAIKFRATTLSWEPELKALGQRPAADLRVGLVLMCGDPFPLDLVLGPFLNHQCCYITRPELASHNHSITFETYLNGTKQKVEVMLSSYHCAHRLRDGLVEPSSSTLLPPADPYLAPQSAPHGFVLVYFTQRRASFVMCQMLLESNQLHPGCEATPTMILGVNEENEFLRSSSIFNNDLSKELFQSGSALAEVFGCHFMTTGRDFRSATSAFDAFLQEAWERKEATEMQRMYASGASSTDGECHSSTPERTLDRGLKPPPDTSQLSGGSGGTSPTPSYNGGSLPRNMGGSGSGDAYGSAARWSYAGVRASPNFQIDNELYEQTPPPPSLSSFGASSSSSSSKPRVDNRLQQQNFWQGTPTSSSSSPMLGVEPSPQASTPIPSSSSSSWVDNDLYASLPASAAPRFDCTAPGTPRVDGAGNNKPKIAPKPGKLNMTAYMHVTDTLSKMNMTPQSGAPFADGAEMAARSSSLNRMTHPHGTPQHQNLQQHLQQHQGIYATPKSTTAPLATPESLEVGTDYAQVKDAISAHGEDASNYASVHDALPEGKLHRIRSTFRREMDKVADAVIATPGKVADAVMKSPHRQRKASAPLADATNESSESEWSSYERRRGLPRQASHAAPATHASHVPMDDDADDAAKPRSFSNASDDRLPDPQRLAGGANRNRNRAAHRHRNSHPSLGRGADEKRSSPAPPNLTRPHSPSEGSDAGTGDEAEGSTPRSTVGAGRNKEKSRPAKKRSFRRKATSTVESSSAADPATASSSSSSSSWRPKMPPFSLGSLGPSTDVCPYNADGETMPCRDDPAAVPALPTTHLPGRTATWREKFTRGRGDPKEKARRKEEKRQREEEKKARKREKLAKKKGAAGAGVVLPGQTGTLLEDFAKSESVPNVPLFVEKCVLHILKEGIDVEGIYRVPGNKAQVDELVKRCHADPDTTPVGATPFGPDSVFPPPDLDIPVNAIATALKGFFNDLAEPLIPSSLYDHLLEAYKVPDPQLRQANLKRVLNHLPEANLAILKYLMQHLFVIQSYRNLNNMDSKNLAIVWWPTLLRPTFTSFESMAASTRLLEQIVQGMIEGCSALFGIPAAQLQSLVAQHEPPPPPPPRDEAVAAAGNGPEDPDLPAASAGTSHEETASWSDGDGGATPRLLSPASTSTVTEASPVDAAPSFPAKHTTAPPTQPPPPPPAAKLSPAFQTSPTATGIRISPPPQQHQLDSQLQQPPPLPKRPSPIAKPFGGHPSPIPQPLPNRPSPTPQQQQQHHAAANSSVRSIRGATRL